jgi:hypothetical protein
MAQLKNEFKSRKIGQPNRAAIVARQGKWGRFGPGDGPVTGRLKLVEMPSFRRFRGGTIS